MRDGEAVPSPMLRSEHAGRRVVLLHRSLRCRQRQAAVHGCPDHMPCLPARFLSLRLTDARLSSCPLTPQQNE